MTLNQGAALFCLLLLTACVSAHLIERWHTRVPRNRRVRRPTMREIGFRARTSNEDLH